MVCSEKFNGYNEWKQKPGNADTGLFREGISSLLWQCIIEDATHLQCRSFACHAAGKLQQSWTPQEFCLQKGSERGAGTTTPAVLHPRAWSIPPFSIQGVSAACLINEGTPVGFWAWHGISPAFRPYPWVGLRSPAKQDQMKAQKPFCRPPGREVAR